MATVEINTSTGNDSTGDGSLGAPYLSLQGAFDDGNAYSDTYRLVGTDTLTGILDTSSCTGTASNTNKMKIVGSGTTINTANGTVSGAIIDGDSQAINYATDDNYMVFENIKFQDFGWNAIRSSHTEYYNCEFTGGSGVRDASNGSQIFNCYFHAIAEGASGYGCYLGYGCKVHFCKFVDVAGKAIQLVNNYNEVSNCIFHGDYTYGVYASGEISTGITNCTFVGDNAAGQYGAYNTGTDACSVLNCVFTNFNNATAYAVSAGGTGASNILGAAGYNSFWNVTNEYQTGGYNLDLTSSDVTESSDPLTDSANNDYSLVSGADAVGGALGL